MTRDDFEQHFETYRAHLREEIHRFVDAVAVYRTVQEQKVSRLATINLAPGFFSVVDSALFTTIVLWADKLFDEQGDRGLLNFLKFVEHDRKWLSVKELQRRKNYPDGHWMLENRTPISYQSIEADRAKVRGLSVLSSFKLRRDKFHGHFDKEYFFDRERLQQEAPITWQDLDEAGILMGRLLNDYSVDFDGMSYSWKTLNINDLEVLLRKAEHSAASAA